MLGGNMRSMRVLFESKVYAFWPYSVFRGDTPCQDMDFYQVLPWRDDESTIAYSILDSFQ